LALLLSLAGLTGCGGGSDVAANPGGTVPDPTPTPPPTPTPTATSCDTATGPVLQVGPGQTYATPSAAAAVARDGDVIEIAAGEYHGDVATWSANDLTICGVGGRAQLYADGQNAQGKAIWVVAGRDITIDSIDFHDASVPDNNGAGIRAEHSGFLVVRNSGFFDNQNGILSTNDNSITVTIEGSEFARNGYGDGFTHNLYIGQIARLTVRDSFFHEAKIGHNLKSRAAETDIQNSYFMDGPSGTSSYLADFPNGGVVYLRGNLFQKGPLAENPNAIAYGEEGAIWGANTLEMVHNTVVMTRAGGNFLFVPADAAQSVQLTANLFAGTSATFSGVGPPGTIGGGLEISSVAMTDNVTNADAADLPGADNIAQPSFWPDAALLDQARLTDVPDPSYTSDSPAPLTERAITGGSRFAGALQAAP
jgi:hypothetical protein